MKKRFRFFQANEGGMSEFDIFTMNDLHNIAYWMTNECIKKDSKLKADMKKMEVGDFVEHRMGTLVRLKDVTDKHYCKLMK